MERFGPKRDSPMVYQFEEEKAERTKTRILLREGIYSGDIYMDI